MLASAFVTAFFAGCTSKPAGNIRVRLRCERL